MVSSIWELWANESYPAVCQSLQTRWDSLFTEAKEKRSKKTGNCRDKDHCCLVEAHVVRPFHAWDFLCCLQAATCTGLVMLHCAGVSSTLCPSLQRMVSGETVLGRNHPALVCSPCQVLKCRIFLLQKRLVWKKKKSLLLATFWGGGSTGIAY